ncbi:MAG: SGNH/GDSL hydrolase family protein [Oscillospiraceae bacterium]|nr:SGNH/GDSL hydrolase family protein [Oscillospiraceae bacterium]
MQNAIQIGIFGDSISKGIVLDEETHRYSTLKKEICQWVTPAAALHNFSVMGSTIQKGISIINRHTEQLSDYQNVFLEFGGNDCDFDWQAVSERPQAHHEPHTPLKQFEALYTKAIQLIQEKKGNPILLTLPPLEPKRYFQWISRNLHANNILHWLGSVDTIYRWQEMYNMKVLLLAQKLRVPVVDIRSAFLAQHGYQSLLCADGIHPNRKGHRFIYKTIMQQYHPCLQA